MDPSPLDSYSQPAPQASTAEQAPPTLDSGQASPTSGPIRAVQKVCDLWLHRRLQFSPVPAPIP